MIDIFLTYITVFYVYYYTFTERFNEVKVQNDIFQYGLFGRSDSSWY